MYTYDMGLVSLHNDRCILFVLISLYERFFLLLFTSTCFLYLYIDTDSIYCRLVFPLNSSYFQMLCSHVKTHYSRFPVHFIMSIKSSNVCICVWFAWSCVFLYSFFLLFTSSRSSGLCVFVCESAAKNKDEKRINNNNEERNRKKKRLTKADAYLNADKATFGFMNNAHTLHLKLSLCRHTYNIYAHIDRESTS